VKEEKGKRGKPKMKWGKKKWKSKEAEKAVNRQIWRKATEKQ
jgi:hypothetical protein